MWNIIVNIVICGEVDACIEHLYKDQRIYEQTDNFKRSQEF